MTDTNREEGFSSARFVEDMDSLKQQVSEADGTWSVDRWVEEEKKRLWLGYFSIKL